MSQIHILDGQKDIILDFITAKNILDDNHKKSLESTLETYDFRTFADKRFSQFLEKRNRIIIPDEDDTLREFIVFEAHRYKDREGHKVQVFANASYLELKKATILYPSTFTGTASQHGGRALNNTGWQIGIVEASGTRTLTIETHTNPYEFLKRIAKEFNAELRFRIEHDGNKVIGRYVDILERVGMWRGREVEFGKDLDGIRRIEKQDIVTALLGLGPEREDGTRLEVLVEDEEALQRWGRLDEHGNLHHLIEPYEIQSERSEMTDTEARQYTRTALDKRIDTHITYETTVVDLENVPGMQNKKIRFGDTIRIKDTKFNPPLYLEARVFEQNRSIKSKAKKEIKLGDYIEYTEEQVNEIWRQMQEEIRKRFARMVIANIISSSGDVFKNGVGSTDLTAITFVGGNEVDEDGTKYDYQWMKFDKEGNHVLDFYEQGKTITINSSSIDEKSTYRVLISVDLEVVTISEITLANVFDGESGERGPEGAQGPKGEKGDDGYTPIKGVDYFDGVDGQDGEDGSNAYLWVRYSQNANGNPMTTDPTNAKYIGVAVTQTSTAPSNYTVYTWSKVRGEDGVPGEQGADGRTSYLHIKYSNDGGATFTSNNGEDVGAWIGTYVDFVQADSNSVSAYTWNKVKGEKGDQGIQGPPGANGQSQYMHIRYSANSNGNPMTTTPQSTSKYIGLANTTSATAPSGYASYTWALMRGADGTDGAQGVPGQKGADGQTTYTWVKYADTDIGGGMSDSPDGKRYIGLAFNKTTATESNVASQYTWSLMPQNIDIGTTNLIRNTSLDFKTSNWTGSWNVTPSPVRFQAEVGQEYTARVYYRNVTGINVGLRIFWYNSTGSLIVESPNSNSIAIDSEGYAELTHKAPSGAVEGNVVLRRTSQTGTGSAQYKELILVKGNKIGSWQPALEDTNELIQKAQTTADGKNTVIYSTTQPSTSGRKINDIWFNTSKDYLMHRFNGSAWVQAPIGEQAIVAHSITANHIKSLFGLNVNDQFIVDNQGNVEFGGHLQGASGTFGDVTVVDGDFNLQESNSNVKYSATPKRNFIKDHSFELLREDPESLNPDSVRYNWLEMLPNAVLADSAWEKTGSPKVAMRFAPESSGALPIHGDKAVVVRSANYVSQYVWKGIAANSQYTISAFFKRQWNVAGGGIPRIEVWHVGPLNNRISKIVDARFPVVSNDYSVDRHAVTINTPLNYEDLDSLEVIISSGNDRWIQCDGVQMVEGDRPSVYQPEDSIWEITNGFYRPISRGHSLWTGERYPLANQTIIPSRPLTEVQNGWVLQWQRYVVGSGPSNLQYSNTHIPKNQGLVNAGASYSVRFPQSAGIDIFKYLYVYHDRITGHDQNNEGDNNRAALTAVFEY